MRKRLLAMLLALSLAMTSVLPAFAEDSVPGGTADALAGETVTAEPETAPTQEPAAEPTEPAAEEEAAEPAEEPAEEPTDEEPVTDAAQTQTVANEAPLTEAPAELNAEKVTIAEDSVFALAADEAHVLKENEYTILWTEWKPEWTPSELSGKLTPAFTLTKDQTVVKSEDLAKDGKVTVEYKFVEGDKELDWPNLKDKADTLQGVGMPVKVVVTVQSDSTGYAETTYTKDSAFTLKLEKDPRINLTDRGTTVTFLNKAEEGKEPTENAEAKYTITYADLAKDGGFKPMFKVTQGEKSVVVDPAAPPAGLTVNFTDNTKDGYTSGTAKTGKLTLAAGKDDHSVFKGNTSEAKTFTINVKRELHVDMIIPDPGLSFDNLNDGGLNQEHQAGDEKKFVQANLSAIKTALGGTMKYTVDSTQVGEDGSTATLNVRGTTAITGLKFYKATYSGDVMKDKEYAWFPVLFAFTDEAGKAVPAGEIYDTGEKIGTNGDQAKYFMSETPSTDATYLINWLGMQNLASNPIPWDFHRGSDGTAKETDPKVNVELNIVNQTEPRLTVEYHAVADSAPLTAANSVKTQIQGNLGKVTYTAAQGQDVADEKNPDKHHTVYNVTLNADVSAMQTYTYPSGTPGYWVPVMLKLTGTGGVLKTDGVTVTNADAGVSTMSDANEDYFDPQDKDNQGYCLVWVDVDALNKAETKSKAVSVRDNATGAIADVTFTVNDVTPEHSLALEIGKPAAVPESFSSTNSTAEELSGSTEKAALEANLAGATVVVTVPDAEKPDEIKVTVTANISALKQYTDRDKSKTGEETKAAWLPLLLTFKDGTAAPVGELTAEDTKGTLDFVNGKAFSNDQTDKAHAILWLPLTKKETKTITYSYKPTANNTTYYAEAFTKQVTVEIVDETPSKKLENYIVKLTPPDNNSDYMYTGKAIAPKTVQLALKNQEGTTVEQTGNFEVIYRDAEGNKLDAENVVNVGTYTVDVQATATSEYSGSTATTFTVVPFNITGKATLVVGTDNSMTYGDPFTTKVTVAGAEDLFDGLNRDLVNTETTLEYEIESGMDLNVGTRTLKVKGVGNFTGTAEVRYTITAKDLMGEGAKLKVVQDKDNLPVYDGSAKTPAFTIEYTPADGTTYTLTMGADADFEVTEWTQNKEVTGAKVKVTMHGNYTGTVELPFTILPYDLTKTGSIVNAAGKSTIAKQTYSVPFKLDFAKEPKDAQYGVIAKFGKGKAATTKPLEPGDSDNDKDYEVGYLNIDKAGKATVIIYGRGNYTGMFTKTFTLAAQKAGGKDGLQQLDLAKAQDSESVGFFLELVSDDANSNDATVTYNADKTKNMPGIRVWYKADKAANWKKNTNTATIQDKMILLTEGTEYTVKASNNAKVGKAADAKAPTVTVTLKGGYSGKLTEKYTIAPAKLNKVVITGAAAFNNNKAVKPKIAVYSDADCTQLVKASEYTCEYYNNTAVYKQDLTEKNKALVAAANIKASLDNSIPYVVVTPKEKGNYYSTISGGAPIEAAAYYNIGTNLAGHKLVLKKATATYTGQAVPAPEIESINKGKTVVLDAGKVKTLTDISYTDAKGKAIEESELVNVGTYYVVATGKGTADGENSNYVGTIKTAFKIVQPVGSKTTPAPSKAEDAQAGQFVVTVNGGTNLTYTGFAQKPTVAVAYKYDSSNTKPLDEKTDYTLSWSRNTTVGTGTVTVKLKGSYKGSVKQEFTIDPVKLDGSNSKVSVSANLLATAAAKKTKSVKPAVSILFKGTKLDKSDKPVETWIKVPASEYTVATVNDVLDENGTKDLAPEKLPKVSITSSAKHKNFTIDETFYSDQTYYVAPKANTLKGGKVTFVGNAKTTEVDWDPFLGEKLGPAVASVATKATKGHPSVTVLAENYKVTYTGNTKVGTGKATVDGDASKNYGGTATASYKIVAADFAKYAKAIADGRQIKAEWVEEKVKANKGAVYKDGKPVFEYDGKAKTFNFKSAATLPIVVKDTKSSKDDVELVYGKDYTVSYQANKNVGEATLVIKGKGNYKGTLELKYSITLPNEQQFQ